MRINCMGCNKPVSTEVPEGTIVRAWVECADCLDDKSLALRNTQGLNESTQVFAKSPCALCGQTSDKLIHQGYFRDNHPFEPIGESAPCVKCGGKPDDWRHVLSGDLDVSHAYQAPEACGSRSPA